MADSPLPIRWCARRLPKQAHTEAECEDAWAADPATGCFAIADGASESAFAAQWAQMLVQGFVTSNSPHDLADWLDGQRRRWSADVSSASLPWYAEMKREEGAFATLLGVTVELPTPEHPGRWRGVAVGDSCLAQVRQGQLVQAFPVAKAADFGTTPCLIGSRKGSSPEPQHGSGILLPGDLLFLMTDALAQWFLHTHELGNRPWEAIAAVLSTDQAEAAFAAWIEELRGRDEQRDDDVTLLLFELTSAPEESSR